MFAMLDKNRVPGRLVQECEPNGILVKVHVVRVSVGFLVSKGIEIICCVGTVREERVWWGSTSLLDSVVS